MRNGSTVETIAVRTGPSRIRPFRKNTLGKTVLKSVRARIAPHAVALSETVNERSPTASIRKHRADPIFA